MLRILSVSTATNTTHTQTGPTSCLMDKGATASEIAGYLFTVATDHMGLTDCGRLAERSDQVAKLLFSLRPEFNTH
jgi:hypothetical protein